MKTKTIAFVQYLEAIMAGCIIKFFLNPIVSGTDNLKKLLSLAKEHKVSVVIISNHINAYDPLYISAALSREIGNALYPVWLPAKKRFFDNSFKRIVMSYHGCLPVGIGKDEDSLKSLKGIIEKLKAGNAICVFPEGQVSRDGTMGEDMGFVTFLARRSTIIVQPVNLSGIMGFKTEWRQLLTRKRQLKIAFGKPLVIEKGESVNSMKLIAGTSA
ncbi:MAG: lysophospholipid acyltransferase family protein [Desulfuromonadales bacterium]